MSRILYERFHKIDDHKFSEREFRTRITVSLFCIVACMVAMLSSAYAWFIVNISSNQTVITSANYTIEVVAENRKSASEVEDGYHAYICKMISNDEHFFNITATGTAQNGYCEVIIMERTEDENGDISYQEPTIYETAPIAQGETLKVCIQAAKGSKIEFIPVWGTPVDSMTTFSLRRPAVFYINHSTTPHIEYLVVEGVTLEALAEYYGVSEEDICIYNGISELVVGDIIKIPGIEDDSIEPYKPLQVNKATPPNATLSDVTTATSSVAEMVEGTTSSETTESSKNTAASSDAEKNEGITSSEESAEDNSELESSGETPENDNSNESEESTAAIESDSTGESASTTESESVNESESVTETEVPSEDIAPSESEAEPGSEEPVLPEMSTEDIEAAADVEPTPDIESTSDVEPTP